MLLAFYKEENLIRNKLVALSKDCMGMQTAWFRFMKTIKLLKFQSNTSHGCHTHTRTHTTRTHARTYTHIGYNLLGACVCVWCACVCDILQSFCFLEYCQLLFASSPWFRLVIISVSKFFFQIVISFPEWFYLYRKKTLWDFTLCRFLRLW
jgi:hypothetical protein